MVKIGTLGIIAQETAFGSAKKVNQNMDKDQMIETISELSQSKLKSCGLATRTFILCLCDPGLLSILGPCEVSLSILDRREQLARKITV